MPIDSAELRQVLSTFVTGVTVITTLDREGRPQGLTANSFNSVSLEPPLVLWSQAHTARSHPVFRDADRFAVNILADDQVAVSGRFARGGEDKFGPTPTRLGLGGVPLLEGCAAWLECRRHAAHTAGDHVVFIGEVERIERSRRRPLAFGGGRYLLAQPHDFARVSAAEAGAHRARLRAARMATHAAVDLAAQTGHTIAVSVWGTHGPTVVHWELAARPVSLELRLGAVLPVAGSATGLLFAAWLPPHVTSPFIEAPQDLAALAERLAVVRSEGMARNAALSRFGDRQEVRVHAVSAPVFDAAGELAVALTAMGEDEQLDLSAQAPVPRAVLACANELTARLSS